MKKILIWYLIVGSIFIQSLATVDSANNGIRNTPFNFNNKQYIKIRIEGLDNIHRNAIKINHSVIYFGTSRGIYVLPSDATEVKKITGIDDKVIALTVDKNNNIYYVTNKYQVFIITIIILFKLTALIMMLRKIQLKLLVLL